MASGIVGGHQQGIFVIPVNGTSPVDADEVRVNDNSVAAQHNAHDSDPTIHVQSGTTAARPVAGTTGRLWYTTDTGHLYYDNGTAWVELKITADEVDGGTIDDAVLPVIPTAKLPVVPITKGGTGTATVPANGQVLIGNGTDYTLATLAAGSNIVITNTAGGITIAAVLSGGAINGSGTVGRLARWTASTVQADSIIRDDGTNVGIGGATVAGYKAAVYGKQVVYGDLALSGDLLVTGAFAQFNAIGYNMPTAQGASESVLQNNGSGVLSWVVPTEPIDAQTFNSSGTWTKPSKGAVAFIEVWGAGGSGAATSSPNTAGGGAGGAYVSRLVPLSSLGSTESVTVGAGGASRTTIANGFSGGNSSFGAWATAYGGSGGANSPTTDAGVTPGSPLRAALGAGSPQLATGTITASSMAGNMDYFDRVLAGGWGAITVDISTLRNSVWGGGGGQAFSGGTAISVAGTSVYAGNGGSYASPASGAGTAPAGGGAGGDTASSGSSGAGGTGRVKITVW